MSLRSLKRSEDAKDLSKMESRLKKRSLRESRRQLYWSLATILIILFTALNFGPYLIGFTGNIVDTITGKSGQENPLISDASLEPPQLDPLPPATPSAYINITGRSFYPNVNAELFVNGKKYKDVAIDEDLDFEIKDVRLIEGENTIKIRTEKDDKKSSFSEEFKILYIKEAPKLEISFPKNQESFSKADQETTVRGNTEPENTVKVNDFIAIVSSDGSFSYVLKLQEGENKITVVAQNPAGQTTSKEITVSYSQ